MKKIKLEKEFVLRLYYFTWQAGRSVHKALGAPWPEFREFYSAARLSALQELIAKLRSLAGPRCRAFRFEDGEAICRPSDFWAIIRHWAGGIALGRWNGAITLSQLQVDYFASMLDSFVHVLGLPEKPQDFGKLISLRIALTHCCTMIDRRWRIGRLVRDQEQIEHFWRADWIEPVGLEELYQRAGLAPCRAPAESAR